MANILEEKYGGYNPRKKLDIPYSEEYRRFKKIETSKSHNFYEGLCHASSKIVRIGVGAEEREKLSNAIRLVHLDLEPEEVQSLALVATVLTFILGVVALFFFFSIYLVLGVLILTAGVFFLLKRVPLTMLNRWRAKASDQLVTAVLYMVINIKKGSNLENAIYFTANQMGPPLSLDFMRLLWEFQVNKYSTVQEALENYTAIWKHQEDQFVDSINLIISSLRQDEMRAEMTLDKATDVILEGVQDHMTHFAHNLQGPVQALHMLGIVLPVLLLVMLPLVASFMKIPGIYLAIGFDVVVPVTVYILARNILSTRPGGISSSNVELQSERFASKFKAVSTAFGVALLFIGIGFGYYILGKARGWEFSRYTDSLLYLSLIGVAGLGFTIVAYLWALNKKALKMKRSVENVEKEFSSAIFQLGNRIEEGNPPERAFQKVAEDTRGTEIQKFFDIVDYNLRVRGMSLEKSLFSDSSGATRFFPSPTIKAIMKLLVEGAKRSLKAAASSLLILSRYLRDIYRVQERLKDLLADTISSIKMQASFFVAVITSIVVGLSVLIVNILSALEGVFRGGLLAQPTSSVTSAGVEGSLGGLDSIAKIFNASESMAGYQFQIMVGIYLILIVILLSYLLSLVVYGGDVIERRQIIISNLFKSIIIYCIGVIIVNTILSSITSGIVEGMVP